GRGARKVQLDLGLDPRLEQMPDCQARVCPRVLDCGVVDMTPNRRRHPILGPGAAVRESNLPADWPLAATDSAFVDLERNRVSAVLVEGRVVPTEWWDQLLRGKGIE